MKSNLLTNSKQRTAKKYNYNTQDNSPIIKFYQKIAYSTPVLPNDKEIELLKSAKNKDCSASREALINAYLRTVILLARKYCFGNNFGERIIFKKEMPKGLDKYYVPENNSIICFTNQDTYSASLCKHSSRGEATSEREAKPTADEVSRYFMVILIFGNCQR